MSEGKTSAWGIRQIGTRRPPYLWRSLPSFIFQLRRPPKQSPSPRMKKESLSLYRRKTTRRAYCYMGVAFHVWFLTIAMLTRLLLMPFCLTNWVFQYPLAVFHFIYFPLSESFARTILIPKPLPFLLKHYSSPYAFKLK